MLQHLNSGANEKESDSPTLQSMLLSGQVMTIIVAEDVCEVNHAVQWSETQLVL